MLSAFRRKPKQTPVQENVPVEILSGQEVAQEENARAHVPVENDPSVDPVENAQTERESKRVPLENDLSVDPVENFQAIVPGENDLSVVPVDNPQAITPLEDAQAIVPYPQPQAIAPYSQNVAVSGVKIKPYCGAKRPGPIEDFNLEPEEIKVYRAPAPAWADVGIVNHMQDAVVPELATTAAVPPHLKIKLEGPRCFFRLSSIGIALVENLFSYLAYWQVGNPQDRFYNKFEAYMLGYPGLDETLLIFSLLNTFYLFSSWILLAFAKRDLYRSMATGRFLISLPIGGMCSAIVFFGEGTNVHPFLCISCVFLHLVVWSCEGVLLSLDQGRRRWVYVYITIIVLICCWWITSLFMFALENSDFLYDSKCPATTKKAMPVRISGLTEWQCVKWNTPHYITRKPPPGAAIYDALCSTSFHDFDTVLNETTGETTPSSAAHWVRCPSFCQSLGLNPPVVGCQVYSATSSICSAALQMGILQTNSGGIVKVIGRPPQQSYQRCNQNGIFSTDTPPTTTIRIPAWAFYFQVAGTADLDMITMHSWEKRDTPGAHEPWKNYKANVTWIVGGTSKRQEVELGPNNGEIELNFCLGSASCD